MVAAAGRSARRGAGGRAGARPDRAGQRHGDRRPLPAGQFRRRALSRRVPHGRRGSRRAARRAGAGCWPRAGCSLCSCATPTRWRCGRGSAATGSPRSARSTHRSTNRPARLDVRADRLDTLTATLAGIGAPLHAWYRGAGLHRPARPTVRRLPERGELQTLLAAEERAGRSDPYRRVAALLHLCGVRGSSTAAVDRGRASPGSGPGPLFGGSARAGAADGVTIRAWMPLRVLGPVRVRCGSHSP